MRRWNGWGEESTVVELPDSARGFLAELVGQGARLPDASLEAALAKVPASRLEADPRYSIAPVSVCCMPAGRACRTGWRCARATSASTRTPWPIRKPPSRSASCWPWPTPRPATDSLWRRCFRGRPYQSASLAAAGTDGLAGAHEPPDRSGPREPGRDLRPGAAGPQVESQLRALGYTLGHFPQSWELSTLGGWVASRSSGQQSLRYGRIEQLFAGGTLETFAGPLEIATFPASAAGPDLRELVLGSEDASGSFPR